MDSNVPGHSTVPEQVALYRFFDQSGQLLYVGITLEIAWRWKSHSKSKPWWRSVSRATIEHFDSRAAALAAERDAIAAERPLWNIVHNGDASTTNRELPALRHPGKWMSMARAAQLLGTTRATLGGTLRTIATANQWWGEGNWREDRFEPTRVELRTERVLQVVAEIRAAEAEADRLANGDS